MNSTYILATVTKELLSELFGEKDVDCYITHIDTYGEDIFTIVILGGRHLIAHFDKNLKLVNHRFIDDTEIRITNLKVVRTGIICSGLMGNDPNYEFNIFVLFKFDFDLSLHFVRDYDMLYTRHNPAIVETPSGDIICAGIRMLMTKQVVNTYCIRFGFDLTMKNSIQYDESESVHITKLEALSDEVIVGAGYKNVINSRTHILTESAIVLLFKQSNLGGVISNEDIWIDRATGNTHINDITVLDTNAFVCIGYSKINKQRATLWKFVVIDKKCPVRIKTKYYELEDINTIYTKVSFHHDDILSIGRIYDQNNKESFMMGITDEGLNVVRTIRMTLFKICEEMNNVIFVGNIIYCIGAKECLINNTCSGLIKRITLHNNK